MQRVSGASHDLIITHKLDIKIDLLFNKPIEGIAKGNAINSNFLGLTAPKERHKVAQASRPGLPYDAPSELINV